MTFELNRHGFINAFPFATLVLVDMRKANLASGQGLQRSANAGILHNCRTALAFARNIGLPVAFVSGSGEAATAAPSNRWIKDFEPQRLDEVYIRRSLSCYSSPYFAEGICAKGAPSCSRDFWDAVAASRPRPTRFSLAIA